MTIRFNQTSILLPDHELRFIRAGDTVDIKLNGVKIGVLDLSEAKWLSESIARVAS